MSQSLQVKYAEPSSAPREAFVPNSSPLSSPAESDHCSSNSPDSLIDSQNFEPEDQDSSDSMFWNSVQDSKKEAVFKSPTTRSINDLIESPILSKNIILREINKDDDFPVHHLEPRKLAFGSPEISRIERITTLRNMTAVEQANFEDSPEAPKALPRALRSAKMLERSMAVNQLLRSNSLTPTTRQKNLKRKRLNDFTVVVNNDASTCDNTNATITTSGDDEVKSTSTSDVAEAANNTASQTSDNNDCKDDLCNGDDDGEEPKRKIRKKLDQLFDETDDWESNLDVESPKPQLQSSPTKTAQPEVQAQVQVPEPEKEPMEVLESKPEVLSQESSQDSQEFSSQEKAGITNAMTALRSPLNGRSTRALAMMKQVMGDRMQLPAASSPSASAMKRSVKLTVSTPNGSPTMSNLRSFSRSHALVQASKKKMEDMVKKVTEDASCPDLFETPTKDQNIKKSCLRSKSPFESAAKQSRRLSFATSIVTDEMFYDKTEPSSCVKRDLELRRKSTSNGTSLAEQFDEVEGQESPQSPESASSAYNTPECSLSPIKSMSISMVDIPESIMTNTVNNEETTSPTKRKMLRQISIIEEVKAQANRTLFDDDNEFVDADEFVPESPLSSPLKPNGDGLMEHDYLLIQSESFGHGSVNHFDLDNIDDIEDEMKSLAQDLTGQNVSNVGEKNAFNDDLFNVSSYSSKESAATFSDDDESSDKEEESIDKENIQVDENLQADKENVQDDKENVQVDAPVPIVVDNLAQEPKVLMEVPLSIARYLFDLLKTSLEPFGPRT